MQLTVRQQVRFTKYEYTVLKELCRISKNLWNQAVYEIRQEFRRSGNYLNYYKINSILKGTENYSLLQAGISQQTLMKIDKAYKSFFALRKKGLKARFPYYKEKDGYYDLILPQARIRNGRFQLPFSRSYAKEHEKVFIRVPKVLEGKSIAQIHIKPVHKARFFEILYIYDVQCRELRSKETQKALAIDIGITNFCTCATSTGQAFIVDGKKLKSYNQWFNKEIARLSAISRAYGYTKRQYYITRKRNNRVLDYIHKTAKHIVDYCIINNIDTVVLGMNEDFQRKSNMGKRNNQNFVQLPFGKLRDNLVYRCEIQGLRFLVQEESYTSKASFLDRDFIPVRGEEIPKFSGRRTHRGLYKSSNGKILNADVNGALNILRKSRVVSSSLDELDSRGNLDMPIRIRIS